MIEFVMVFPLILVLFCSMIEFGYLSLAHQNVQLAAFNAARARIVGDENTRLAAAMSLYALSPTYIEGLEPGDYIKYLLEEKVMNEIEKHVKALCPQFASRSGDWANMQDKIIGIFTDIFKFLMGAADPLFEAANDGIPGVIKKMAFAWVLTSTSESIKTYEATPNPSSLGDFMTLRDLIGTHEVTVTVTYRYPLKFPVIDRLFEWIIGTMGPTDATVYNPVFNDTTFLISPLRFVPITQTCTMGMEVVP